MEEADDLLDWWNEQFQTQHTSLAALADGVQYMQLVDALLGEDGGLLQTLQMLPGSREERVHNLQLVQQAIRHTGIGVELTDIGRLADADEAEHFLVASALRQYAEASALRMDALEGYAALKARMEAAAAQGIDVESEPIGLSEPPMPAADARSGANSADPKLTQRRDELGQLVECLQQELAKRMRALEDTQAEFYEVRHERELLFGALQRIEHVCMERCEGDPEDPLAADLLSIIAEVPADFLAHDEVEADDESAENPADGAAAVVLATDTVAKTALDRALARGQPRPVTSGGEVRASDVASAIR